MLEIKNLRKVFYEGQPEENIIFENFNLTIEENKCLAILGPNGCGKSTLLNLISGSLASDGGMILLNGKDITKEKEEKHSSL